MSNATRNDEGFSAKRTAEIVGITYRQLDHWARTHLVEPSLAAAQGSGSRRRYAYRDLLELKVVKTLVDAGIRLQKVRDVFSFVGESLDQDITRLNLVLTGDTVLVHDQNGTMDLLRRGQGVLMLNILPLAGVKEELDATIIELFPTEDDDEPSLDAPAVGD
tara:strand:- start:36 stop:521 length:486 start_codon:yes stop_codon:yes gene_type:complete